MGMPGRTWQGSADQYRYSHNGHEKEDEIYDNAQSAEYWMYDARIGRRWEKDPVQNISMSPYATFEDNPVLLPDPNGERVIFGSFWNFLKVAFNWVTDKAFRQDWKKNVGSKYRMGGKSKADLHLKVDKGSKFTLSEAVADGNFEGGSSKGGVNTLTFNGNTGFAIFEMGTDYEAKWNINIPSKAYYNRYLVETYKVYNKPKDFMKWSWDREKDSKIEVNMSKIREKDGEIEFDIKSQHHKVQESYAGMRLTESPAILSIEFKIKAMGKRSSYKVERNFFHWDKKNKTPSSLPPTRSDIEVLPLKVNRIRSNQGDFEKEN